MQAWDIIVGDGLGGVTLRKVAAAAGMANGALKPYFESKEHLMLATFQYVCRKVTERAAAGTSGLTGFDAVRAFSLEILPTNKQLVEEARVIIGFWALAAHDPDMAKVNDQLMGQWRSALSGWVSEQEAQTGFREGITVDILVDGLMTFLLGTQVSVTVNTVAVRQDRMSDHLDALMNTYLPDDAVWERGRVATQAAAQPRAYR